MPFPLKISIALRIRFFRWDVEDDVHPRSANSFEPAFTGPAAIVIRGAHVPLTRKLPIRIGGYRRPNDWHQVETRSPSLRVKLHNQADSPIPDGWPEGASYPSYDWPLHEEADFKATPTGSCDRAKWHVAPI